MSIILGLHIQGTCGFDGLSKLIYGKKKHFYNLLLVCFLKKGKFAPNQSYMFTCTFSIRLEKQYCCYKLRTINSNSLLPNHRSTVFEMLMYFSSNSCNWFYVHLQIDMFTVVSVTYSSFVLNQIKFMAGYTWKFVNCKIEGVCGPGVSYNNLLNNLVVLIFDNDKTAFQIWKIGIQSTCSRAVFIALRYSLLWRSSS